MIFTEGRTLAKGDFPMSENAFVIKDFGGGSAESKKNFQSGTEVMRRLLDSSSDFITLIDKEGTIIEMNEHAARRLGASPGELMGVKIYDLFSPKVAKRRRLVDASVVESGKPLRVEGMRDGLWFDAFIFPIFGEEGTVESLSVFARDITERKHMERQLKEDNVLLKKRCEKYADELGSVSEALKKERQMREKLEKRLKDYEKELSLKTDNLRESFTAIEVLIQKRSQDRQKIEENVVVTVKELVYPFIEKLKEGRLNEEQRTYVSIIESSIKKIVTPFARRMSNPSLAITPTEMKVATLIKQGKTTKEIAELSNLSIKTIETHRKNIRKKLGIKNKKTNLHFHLMALE